MSNIHRTKRTHNFTVISNELLNDQNLDWRDVGLLAFLLSKPDDWKVSVAHLKNFRQSGRDAIYKSLSNIIKAGYCRKKPNPKGGWDYEITDNPIWKNSSPLTENPLTENPTLQRTELPLKNNNNKKKILQNNNNNKNDAPQPTEHPKTARHVVLKNLSEAEHKQAMQKLESISPEQAALLIESFNKATPASSPMMLFNGLLKKAKANLLEKAVLAESTPQPNYYESQPRAKATPKKEGSQAHHAADLMKSFKNGLQAPKQGTTTPTLAQQEGIRIEVIKTLLRDKKAEWLREFKEKSFVSCRGVSGVILEPDLRAAGLFD